MLPPESEPEPSQVLDDEEFTSTAVMVTRNQTPPLPKPPGRGQQCQQPMVYGAYI